MTGLSSRKTELPDGLSPKEHPEARGFVDGDWYVEETRGAVRQSIKLRETLHQEQTEYQKLAVYDTEFFGKMMTLDDIVMLTERDEFIYHEMLVHVPLCSIENPRRVLIIGGGDCGCLREALKHDSIEEVVQVDIDRRVTEVSAEHFNWVDAARRDARATLLFEDGVRYIQEHPRQFDLVIIDSTDPEGFALSLFLSEFYAQVANSLRPGGVMTAQTESPHWSADMVSAIYGELQQAFASVSAYLASVPTYASGLWTLAYCSSGPRSAVDPARAERIAAQCRYYNRSLHEAAFALPNFVRETIG
ncbi:MAG: polyamine aminopropyltransferase [Myxococcota bacterium]